MRVHCICEIWKITRMYTHQVCSAMHILCRVVTGDLVLSSQHLQSKYTDTNTTCHRRFWGTWSYHSTATLHQPWWQYGPPARQLRPWNALTGSLCVQLADSEVCPTSVVSPRDPLPMSARPELRTKDMCNRSSSLITVYSDVSQKSSPPKTFCNIFT